MAQSRVFHNRRGGIHNRQRGGRHAGLLARVAEQLLEVLRDKTARLQALDGPLPRSLSSTTQAFAH